MKKKITALVLAVIMCLSFIVSAAAADTLKRVPSTIPGTDKEYNYVENVTVKIPGTNVTFDFKNVASFVLVNQEYTINRDGIDYKYDIPAYRFITFEPDGKATANQNGTWLYTTHDNPYVATANIVEANKGYCFDFGETGNILAREYDTIIDSNNVCSYPEDVISGIINDDAVAIVQILCVNKKFDFNHYKEYSKNEYNVEYDFDNMFYRHHVFDKAVFDKTVDISLLDVNYKPSKEYKITDGANSVVNSDVKSLKIKADGEFSKFTGVKVDGKTVDSSNYTASEGSTIIELHGEYLKTLKEGNHSVTVVFTDGEASTQFEIKKDKNTGTANKTDKPAKPDIEIPNTDMDSSVTAIFAVMALSGTAVIVFKKKKYTL